MSLRIGNIEIDPPVGLAPMAGVTDEAFRVLCREKGCGLVVTEMVSAKALVYQNRGTRRLLLTNEAERPVAVQLFGSDPDIMAEAAAQVSEGPCDIIDINMGCPMPKIVKNGDGSALMRDPKLAGRIVAAVVSAQKKPVTVKIRRGIAEGEETAPELALILEDNGASAVCVHGRTAAQLYSGKADLGCIRRVKEAVSVPVFGNGDVTDGAGALSMMRETGCDGVMVGRAAMGDPWVFSRIAAALAGDPVPEPPGPKERAAMMRRHADRLIALKGERTAILEMRKHAAWYTAGLKGASAARRALNTVSTAEELYNWLTSIDR